MKKIFKKLTVLLMAALMVVSSVAFVGCDDDSGDKNKDVYVLTLDATNKNISILDEFYLGATFTEIPDTTLTFASSNESVVSVNDEGKVKGESLGSATITATYGKKTATCDVNVSIPNERPYISLQGIANIADTLNVIRDEPFALNTLINYKGLSYSDAQVDYALSESTYGSIQNGVYTPTLPAGETSAEVELTITASWRGITSLDAPTLKETVKINVVDVEEANGSSYLLINNSLAYPGSMTLYKAAEVDGVKFEKTKDFIIRTVDNGILSEDASNVSIVSSVPGVVVVEDDKIIAGDKGFTVLTISITNPGENSMPEVTSVSVPVEVKYPVIEKSGVFNMGNVSIKDGYDLTEVQQIYAAGSEHTITSAIQNYEQQDEVVLSVEDGVVKGFVGDNKEIKKAKITLFTDEYGYTFDADIYTDVITTAEELELALKLQATTIKNARGEDREIAYKDGVYILGANISVSGTWAQDCAVNYNGEVHYGVYDHGWQSNDYGFAGYFDGNGHTITFAKIGRDGIFGRIRDGAIIKNVDFEIQGMEHSANTRNVVLALAIGHNYSYGSGNNELAKRTIEKTYLTNISIRVLPTSANKIVEFDGMFGIINNAKWYGPDVYREVKLTNIYMRLNGNVVGAYDTSDKNYGLIMSISAGNVLGVRDHIQDAAENVVILSSKVKELVSVVTSDSFVLDKNTGVMPAGRQYNFFAPVDAELLNTTQSWFAAYNSSLMGKDDPSRTAVSRFLVEGVVRYNSPTTLLKEMTHVGCWQIDSPSGNTVTFDPTAL